jgi:colanic acid/amylovoran biosynthesis glycosyltransferase
MATLSRGRSDAYFKLTQTAWYLDPTLVTLPLQRAAIPCERQTMSAYETDSSHLTPPGPIAYLMPEFPGQTHVWFWREVSHMRDWGVDVRLFSTRPPDEQAAARHAFAEQAKRETIYLLPRPVTSVVAATVWGLRRPRQFARAAMVPFTLEGMSLRQRATTLPLLFAGCIFAREAVSQGIRHVHLHSAARSAVIALMARQLSGLPYSFTLHGNLDWWGGGMASKLENAEFAVAVAEWLRDDIRRTYPQLHPSAVVVASMGVDTRTWVPVQPSSGNLTFQLMTVGRLALGKGHDVTLRALAQLRESGRDVRLSIIGSGPDRAVLESLINELGLERSVDLLGTLSEGEVIETLGHADAFVLASRVEPRAVAYMEAMALGLPTVGTDVGGSAEIITNEHDGLLVPAEDEEGLAGAIARLMDDPGLRRHLGRNARRTAVERFDSRISAAPLYERLFGIPPPSASPTRARDDQGPAERGKDRAGLP